MMLNAIGLVETNSIARGLEVADIMVKTAEVTLLSAKPICPGKYMVLVAGEVAAVKSSVQAGAALGGNNLVDEFVIPNVYPSIFPAITGSSRIERVDALGAIETFSVASLIVAADAAVKAAAVEPIEIRLAVGLGGKSFVTLTGEVSAVEAAVSAGVATVTEKGLLAGKTIIPSPAQELVINLL